MNKTTHDAEGPPPRCLRLSAAGRSNLQFRSLLHSEVSRFLLGPENLEGIAKERDKVVRGVAIFFFVSIALAFLIIWYTAPISVTVRSPVVEAQNIPLSIEILYFALAATTSYYATRWLSGILLSSQIEAIVRHLGFEAPEYFVTRWSGGNLWADLLRLRLVGYSSRAAHKFFVTCTVAAIILIAAAQIAILIFAAWSGLVHVGSTGSLWVRWFIVLPSFVAIHIACILPWVAVFVPLKFELPPERAETDPAKDAEAAAIGEGDALPIAS